MGKVKQIEIKNRTYYFYNDIINIEEFDSNFKLNIDKKLIFTRTKAFVLDTIQLKKW